MSILNMDIESMDVFKCLYMIDYICYSGDNTFIYICLVCLLLLRENCNCNCIRKAQQGSTSIVLNKVRFYIP